MMPPTGNPSSDRGGEGRDTVRTAPTLAALLALLVFAFTGAAVRKGVAPQVAAPPFTTGFGTPSAAGASIPVPPPPGAQRTPTSLAPQETLGSFYLHMQVHTYRTARTPDEVYAYYAPRLKALGYTSAGSGETCSPKQGCRPFWSFQHGQNALIVLSTGVQGGGRLRYSIAMERIIVPPRSTASLVPWDVGWVEVVVQIGDGADRIVTITDAGEIARLRWIANSLPLLSSVGHGGCGSGRANLRFATGQGDFDFSEVPRCGVSGPAQTLLIDPGLRLWHAALYEVHTAS
ncbi:MAG: hypothetical protein M0Z66_13535 [Thermaerobacter sp.]|nr:hypothetical protein [Thermaerobacter sp.]